jgi:hypothetical protein
MRKFRSFVSVAFAVVTLVLMLSSQAVHANQEGLWLQNDLDAGNANSDQASPEQLFRMYVPVILQDINTANQIFRVNHASPEQFFRIYVPIMLAH